MRVDGPARYFICGGVGGCFVIHPVVRQAQSGGLTGLSGAEDRVARLDREHGTERPGQSADHEVARPARSRREALHQRSGRGRYPPKPRVGISVGKCRKFRLARAHRQTTVPRRSRNVALDAEAPERKARIPMRGDTTAPVIGDLASPSERISPAPTSGHGDLIRPGFDGDSGYWFPRATETAISPRHCHSTGVVCRALRA
jgi:hypothetical protein